MTEQSRNHALAIKKKPAKSIWQKISRRSRILSDPSVFKLAWLGPLFLLLGQICCNTASASWLKDVLIDPQDGMLDASDYLASARGFLPVPIIITEPAVGYGLGLVVAYFHKQKKLDTSVHQHKGPPSISVGFGAKTENGTNFLGAAYSGIWKSDHIRYTAAAVSLDVNAKWYGLNSGQTPTGDDFSQGVNFNSNGGLIYQSMKFRLKESNWWLGGNYIYSDIDNIFKVITDVPIDIPATSFNASSGGAGIEAGYDGRNTTFTPSKGTRLYLRFTDYGETWGGDDNYRMFESGIYHYIPVGQYSSLGLRLEANKISGQAPFYAYPYVELRGIPALRYQGQEVINSELEYLWGFTPRWTAVLFTGIGNTSGESKSGGASDTVHTVGVGARYRLARKFGLQAGIDVARGPEDTSFYITIGSAWGGP